MGEFVGRSEELRTLHELREKESASLVVVYGRRRIGKSRLIEEFGKSMRMLTFSGLPPRVNSDQHDQRNDFARQMARELGDKGYKQYHDWGDIFFELAQRTAEGRVLILLDEISWVGSQDPDFLGKLKNAWDLHFKKNPQLILVLCGSVSAWICQRILSSTGFYGRISLKLHLKELPLRDCIHFWKKWADNIADVERLKLLAVTGGIPKYLEEMNPRYSAEDNIKRLCFRPTGFLFNEFEQIFSGMLSRKSTVYQALVLLLANGMCSQTNIAKKLGIKQGGYLSDYLSELVSTGFLSCHHSWNLKNGKSSKIAYYRLSDNYLRFYIKYILPNTDKILSDDFAKKSLMVLPGWSSVMALQIENLVLSNRYDIIQRLGICPDEILCDGPFFQRKTTRVSGCQIDYMIQTRFNSLYICEVTFSGHVLRSDIISMIKEKIATLKIPKHVSIRPVLIHAGDVHDDVYDSEYFFKIINLLDLLH